MKENRTRTIEDAFEHRAYLKLLRDGYTKKEGRKRETKRKGKDATRTSRVTFPSPRLTRRRQEFHVLEFFEFFRQILAFFSRSSYVSRHRG